MTGSNRLAMTLAASAVSVTLASGCTAAGGGRPASSPTGQGTATAGFSAVGLAFRYPAAWRLGRWSADVSSFTALIVDLSTSRLNDPCSTPVGRIRSARWGWPWCTHAEQTTTRLAMSRPAADCRALA